MKSDNANINGIIVINKEKGFTSHDVVAKMRRILGTRKIGHTGTLDPEAAGVLPVCIGKATKVCDMILNSDKEYIAEIKFGITTDTQDIFGNILEEKSVLLSKGEIENAVMSFEGEIEQIPPMYSAIKVGGKKLCDLARKGIEVERKPRKICIYEINILSITEDSFTIDVKCSKGTYIRTLGFDIGEKLGCGAVMTSLVRTQSAIFTADSSVKLNDLTPDNYRDFVIPADRLFDYDKIAVKGDVLRKILNGNSVKFEGISDGKMYRVYDENGRFLCISYAEDGILKVRKMFYVGE